MSIKTLFLSALCLCGLTYVNAEPINPPLKLRLNGKVLKNIVHMRDQEVFKVFTDKEIPSENLTHNTNITFSLEPTVNVDDFDFDVHISQEYLGAETDKVVVKGKAIDKEGKEHEFTAPIPLIKLKYVLGTKLNEQYKIDALHFHQEEWTYSLGQVNGASLSSEAKEEIQKEVGAFIDNFKTKFEKGDKKGNMQYIEDFPMDTVIPVAILYYVVNFAKVYEVENDYISMGFDLQHFKMLKDKQYAGLKPIETSWRDEINPDGDEMLIQLSIDDNVFNSVSTVFTSVDKSFSARDIVKTNPKLRPMVQQMNTNMIGTVIPTFTQEYGENKAVDVMWTTSHDLFSTAFPNAKSSGVYIDKNGNWKLQLNLVFNLMVQNSGKNWDAARDIYMTLVFKQKTTMFVSGPSSKKFTWAPKNFEMTNLKVFKDDKEMEMEQMMIQSVINIQLENMKKEFKEFPFYMSNLLAQNPKELACLGFNVVDLDMSFKKSNVLFSAYQRPAKYQNAELCEKFLQQLRESPNKILDQFDPQKTGSAIGKAMLESQKAAQGDKAADPFAALGDLPPLDLGNLGLGQKEDPAAARRAQRAEARERSEAKKQADPDHEEL